MILKDLLLKYEFDALVPDLIAIDEQVKNNLLTLAKIHPI